MSGDPNILRTALDPHHEPYPNQWGWDGSHLYTRENVPTRRWVKVKRISFTPARVKALAALVSCEGVDLERCACCGQQFDANHLDHDTLTCQNCISAAVDLYYSQGEAAELRAALGATVDAINGALIYHGHVISTPVMGELSKASNEADALLRRLAGGESRSAL